MTSEEFRKNGHLAIDWVADYLENIEEYPVKSQALPGEIFNQIPDHPPIKGESFEEMITDLDRKIIPGMTHWQHPNFHAYFNGNSSYPSILAELFTSALGAQCMIWETSPAAAELEEKMMEWLKQMCGLPQTWDGVIQDTASTATLIALLSAREKMTNLSVNNEGFGNHKLRVYCSTEAHSSIDKAIKITGMGLKNLVKIEVDDKQAMVPEKLAAQIETDIQNGYTPCAVVSAIGTTGTVAIDPLNAISEITHQYKIWHHVDAAYAGTAFVLPEYRHFIDGLDLADSYVFNPHKWMFTNFDCSAYFVREKEWLIRTFEILPEYLKTGTRGIVNDYRDWGIQLGRRFRALKLWFVIRDYGVAGIQKRVSEHISYGKWLEEQILQHPDFEMMATRHLNVVVFRYINGSESELNNINENIIKKINESGKAYLTHTKIKEKYVIRIVPGQSNTQFQHVEKLWKLILEIIDQLY